MERGFCVSGESHELVMVKLSGRDVSELYNVRRGAAGREAYLFCFLVQ